MVEIATLVKRLKGIRWSWDEPGMKSALASLDAAFIESVPGRTTYAIDAGLRLSVYLDDAQSEFLEITVDSFFDPQHLSPDAYEVKVDEYFAKYENAVAEAETVLGPPIFNDGAGSEGFPEEQEAVWLAQWDLPTATFMIQQKHEDKELPFRLCIVLTPPSRS